MTSMASDTESNVSGFIRYSEQNITQLYTSAIESMEQINQDLLQVERNLKNIVNKSGPLESQLNALLHSLPRPNVHLEMDTE